MLHQIKNAVGGSDYLLCSRASNALYAILSVINTEHRKIVFSDIMCPGPVVAAYAADYVPVFCDIEMSTFSLCPNSLDEILRTEKVGFVVAPHMYGYPCKLEAISDVCKRHNVYLIEDAAQAYGIHSRSKNLNGLADFSIFSFGPSKIMPIGSGGLITTSDNRAFRELGHFLQKLHHFNDSEKIAVNYKSSYYNIQQNGPDAQELRKLYFSLTPLYTHNTGLPNLQNFAQVFKRQESIFDQRRILFERINTIKKVNFSFDMDTFIPWRYTYLHHGSRDEYLHTLRHHGVHCSAWYNRCAPVFCKDAVSVNENAEKFARKVVNLWCDPELPEEYYVKQDEVLRRIDT